MELLTDGGGQKGLLPEFFHTFSTMIKLRRIIPYLKKIQKIYKSRDTLLKFLLASAFFHQKSVTFVI